MVSPIRFGGIASGLDTENMIKQLMQAERAPLDKLLQKKQKEEWRRDSFREMNSQALELRNKVFDLRFSSAFNKQKATVDDETKVGIQLTGQASGTAYAISDVNLGTAATAASIKLSNNIASDTTKMSDAGLAAGFTFDVTGTGSATITVATGDTIKSVIQKINDKSTTTGVTAAYSATDKSIVFTSTTKGTASAATISNVSAANPLNISAGTVSNVTNNFGANGYQGVNAVSGSVKVNGVSYALTSNTLELDGMKFTFKQAGFAGSVNVNVGKDVDAIFNSIKGFVDKYNEVIGKFNSKLTESVDRGFQPLLDEQKEGMTEKQIETWESKAKSGLLRRDSILGSAISDMRLSFFSPLKKADGTALADVNANFDTLSEIGIGPAKADSALARVNSMEKGKIYIDETKLRDAITNNSADVEKLFTRTGNDFNEKGLAMRVYEQVNTVMDRIKDRAGSSGGIADNSTIGQNLGKLNTQIYKWEDRLVQVEDRYWKQFTAMEKALERLNSQKNWLSQQLSGGQ